MRLSAVGRYLDLDIRLPQGLGPLPLFLLVQWLGIESFTESERLIGGSVVFTDRSYIGSSEIVFVADTTDQPKAAFTGLRVCDLCQSGGRTATHNLNSVHISVSRTKGPIVQWRRIALIAASIVDARYSFWRQISDKGMNIETNKPSRPMARISVWKIHHADVVASYVDVASIHCDLRVVSRNRDLVGNHRCCGTFISGYGSVRHLSNLFLRAKRVVADSKQRCQIDPETKVSELILYGVLALLLSGFGLYQSKFNIADQATWLGLLTALALGISEIGVGQFLVPGSVWQYLMVFWSSTVLTVISFQISQSSNRVSSPENIVPLSSAGRAPLRVVHMPSRHACAE